MEPNNFWTILVVSIPLLYLAKYCILWLIPNRWTALALFIVLLTVCTCLMYSFDVGYTGRRDSPYVHSIGLPVSVLTVPTVSFLHDWSKKSLELTVWHVGRTALEVIILVPLWIVVWGLIQLIVLGWVVIDL